MDLFAAASKKSKETETWNDSHEGTRKIYFKV